MSTPSGAGSGPAAGQLGLVQALDDLAGLAGAAGVDPALARAEGAAFAAAVAESATGAAQAWAASVGGGVQDFFDAASRARRWRVAPTDVLAGLVAAGSPGAPGYARALTEVAASACGLGEPSITVVAAASGAAAAQLRAAGAGARDAYALKNPALTRPTLDGLTPNSLTPNSQTRTAWARTAWA